MAAAGEQTSALFHAGRAGCGAEYTYPSRLLTRPQQLPRNDIALIPDRVGRATKITLSARFSFRRQF